MAGKFNTRFVLILASVLVVLVAGGTAFVFSVTRKSTAELEALGDNHLVRAQNTEVDLAAGPEAISQAQQQRGQDYRLAAESYGKAWQREPQKVELLIKYIEARSNMAVKDQFEAKNVLDEISSLTRQTTELRPNDEQMLEDYYQLLYRWAREFKAIGFYDQLFSLASTRLESDPQNLPALKFRGISQAVQISDAIDRTRQQEIRQDLEAVLAQRPEDTDVLYFLARWHLYDADRTERVDPRSEQAGQARVKAVELVERALAVAEDNLQVQAEYFNIRLAALEHEYRTLGRSDNATDRIAAAQRFREGFDRFSGVLDQLEAALLENPEPPALVQQVAEILPRVEKQIAVIDRVIAGMTFEQIEAESGGREHLGRTERLLRRSAEARPDMLLYRIMLANVLKRQIRLDEAHGIYASARDYPIAGSFETSLRDQALQQQAVYEVANIELIRAETATEPELRQQLLADADLAVDALEAVSDKDARVLMLRGKLAMLRGQNTQAMVLIDQASGLYQDSNIEALLLSARARQSQKQWGAAAERLKAVLDLIAGGGREDLRSGIRLQYAEMLIRSRNFPEARRQLNGVLEAEPANAAAARLLAQWHSAQSQYDQAIAVLEALPNRDDPAVQRSLAELYKSAGQSDRSQDILLAEFERDPANTTVLQRVLSILETPEEQYAALDRALENGANASAIGVLRAQLDSRLNQQPITLDDLIDQIDKNGGNPADNAARKARAYLRYGQVDKARESFEIAQAANPDSDDLLVLAFDLALREKEFDKARRLADTAGSRDLDLARGNFLKGQLAAAEGKAPQAISFYGQALELRPVFDEGWRQYGDLLLSSGDPNEAVSAFNTALSQKPDNTQALLGLANAQNALGRHAQALEALRTANAYRPNNATVRNRYLAYEQRFGNPETALQARRELAESRPEDTANIVSLATLIAQEGDLNEALSLLDRAEAKTGVNLQLVGARATVYQLAEQPEAGLQVINDYLLQRGGDATSADYLLQARYYLTLRRFNESVAAYRQAIEREDPRVRLASRQLADLFFSSGRMAESMEIYEDLFANAEENQKPLLGQRLAETMLRQQLADQAEGVLDQIETTATSQALRSLIALQRGDREMALEFVNASLDQDDRNATTYIQRAALFSGDPQTIDLALDDLRQALSINPNAIQALAAQARIYTQLGQNDQAIAALRSLLENAPGNHTARSQLAQLYLGQGQANQAALLVAEGLENEPNNPAWLQLSAGIANAQGDTRGAISSLEQLMESRPNVQTLTQLSSLYLQQNQPAEAQALLDEWPEEVNASPVLQGVRGATLAGLGQTEPAQRVFALALQRSTSQTQIDQILTRMVASLGEPQATTLLQDTEGLQDPSWAGLSLANLAAARSDFDGTLAHLDAVRPLVAASNTAALVQIDRLAGLAMLQTGNDAGARDAYTRLLEADPNNPEALNNLAYILGSRLNDPQAALPLAKRASDQNPNDAGILDTLGWTYYEVGQIDEARSALQRSIRLRPLPTNTLNLGRIYLETGELSRARQMLQQCLELSEAAGDTDTADRARRFMKQL